MEEEMVPSPEAKGSFQAQIQAALSRAAKSRMGAALSSTPAMALYLAAIIFLVSYPLFTSNTWYPGEQDIVFHLSRIEGIKQGLQAGQFPVKIEPPQLNGVGYANGVFYPDLFLYLPATLCLLGMETTCAWNVLLVLTNAACCLVAYWCFKRMLSSRALGLLAAFLYTAGYYRLMDVYLRSALGEHIAIIFFPLVAYGLWRIYSSGASKQVQHAWIPLTIAFVGIMQSHVLSVEIAGIFVLIVMLVRWRTTFSRPVLVCWLKVIVLFILLNLFFLVPFVDYMQGDFSITDPSRKTWTIQSSGINPLEYLILLPNDFFRQPLIDAGLTLNMPLGVGSGLLVGYAVLGWVVFSKKKFKERGVLLFVFALGTLALWMSTCLFPWDAIEFVLGPLGSLVSNIQFPWRFLGMASMLVVLGSCGALKVLAKEGKCLCAVSVAIVMVVLTAMTAYLFVSQQFSSAEPFDDADLAYYLGSSDYGSVGNGEYLPGEAGELDQEALVSSKVTSSEGTEVTGYYKEYLSVKLSVANSSDAEGYVDVPLLSYKGYQAFDAETGEGLEVESAIDDNFVVRVLVPAGYSGTVQVAFVEPWYWRMAEAISVLTLVGVSAGGFARMRRRTSLRQEKRRPHEAACDNI